MQCGNTGRMAATLALLAGLSGCVSTGRLPPARADAPALDALAFFTGQSRGEGTLKIALRRPRAVMVASVGRWGSDGGLSDAAGPVTGRIEGNRLHLRFSMNGGLRADQWLALQPGGQMLHNVMIVRKFGLPVARLDEVIMRENW